ncbi:MAG: ATP-binding protein [Frankiales bacterium]|nr:ATP-binding protein [Frankiales bacterium]
MELPDYVHEIVGSGFPQARVMPDRPRQVWLDNYINRLVTHDFSEQGQPVRQPETLLGWLRGYARATATSTTWAKISASVEPGESNPPAASTALRYRDILSSLYILDQVEAWSPSRRVIARAATAPKHFLVDPALSVRLLGLNETRLMSAGQGTVNDGDRTRLGVFFEALVALSLKTYAAANDASLSHFRDRDGVREIDFVIHKGDSTAVAVEVKLKATVSDDDVRHLLWLRDALPDQVVDMVVITTGPYAYRRPDGVAVVPLALLTA